MLETDEGTVDRLEQVAEPSAHSDPQRVLFSRQLKHRIEETLDQMTPRERMVFEMRHYQGMRLRAIGEILGTTEEAAKNCLFRATQKMRSALGEYL
jgi:RNA polymerase sigma-70 factor (ECF subfamily)